MTKLRSALMWLYMLNKRLYKRPSFIIMLVAVALITAVFGAYANRESYVLKIAICAGEDAAEFLREHTDDDTIIGYSYFKTEEEAISAVSENGYDAAWIFEKGIDAAAMEYVEHGEPVVKVVQREDTIFLRIAREKLFATVYPKLSRALYINYAGKNLEDADEATLNGFYDREVTDDEIIEIMFNDFSEDVDKINHLTAPIRGLLAIAMFLCAYAALINYKKDRNSGLLARMPAEKHIYVEVASILVSVINQAIVMLISLKLCGLFTTWSAELLYILQYILLCTAFCVVFGGLVDNISAMSAVLPIISMLMIVLCPVFLNTQKMKFLQILMPPYYYLSAFRNAEFLMYGFLYILGAGVIYAILRHIKRMRL